MQETPPPAPAPRFPAAAWIAIGVVVVLGAAAAGGVVLARSHAADSRIAAARAEVAPLADSTLSHDRVALDLLADDILSLDRRLDDELGASSLRAIDVNGNLAAQGGLQRRLAAVADDLGALDRQQEIARLAHRLPNGTALLTDGQLGDLRALQVRQADLAKQASAFDSRIALAAERREKLAREEREDHARTATAHAVENQAQATGQTPEAVAAAVTSPTVISSPGAKTDAQKKAMADAISSQAQATGQTPEQVADAVDTVIAPAVPTPAPNRISAPINPTDPPPPSGAITDTDEPAPPTPPAPPVVPQPGIVVQPQPTTVYVYPAYPYYYAHPYRPFYGPNASFYWHAGPVYHGYPPAGSYHH